MIGNEAFHIARIVKNKDVDNRLDEWIADAKKQLAICEEFLANYDDCPFAQVSDKEHYITTIARAKMWIEALKGVKEGLGK